MLSDLRSTFEGFWAGPQDSGHGPSVDRVSSESSFAATNSRNSRRPSVDRVLSDFSIASTGSPTKRRPSVDLAEASKQADLLRKRREKKRPGNGFAEDDAPDPELFMSKGSEPFQSKGSERLFDSNSSQQSTLKLISRYNDTEIKDMVEGLRQLILDASKELGQKIDKAVSNMDASFAAQVADLARNLEKTYETYAAQREDETERAPRHAQPKAKTGPGLPSWRSQGFPQAQNTCKGHGIAPPTPPPCSPRNPCSPPKPEEDNLSNSITPSVVFKAVRSKSSSSLGAAGILTGIAEQSRITNRSRIAQMVWLYLEDPRLVPTGKAYARLLMGIILSSCCVTIVQTVESPPLGSFAEAVLGYTVDCILSAEIFLRFVVCPNRISFWTQGLNLLDLLTGPLTLLARIVLPIFYPDHSATDSTTGMIMNSWLPVGQLLRLVRRFESSYLIFSAFRKASEALPMLLYVLLLIITTFASLLYALEPRHNIGSLPESLWFTVVTIGTVGYGDVTPETPEGKFAACLLVIVSALYMAIPLGIVGHVFAEVWDDRTSLMLRRMARQRFQSLGYTAKDIPSMFVCADVDADGVLNMQEFITMMKTFQFDTTGERAVELFKIFDHDGEGTIDDHEFLMTLFPGAEDTIYGAHTGLHDDFAARS